MFTYCSTESKSGGKGTVAQKHAVGKVSLARQIFIFLQHVWTHIELENMAGKQNGMRPGI